MYFGLIEVLTYFMDLISKVFIEYLDKFIIVFIDGILVYSKSKKEHEEHLRLVSQKLQDPRLYVKIRKCKF
jgi:Zn-dependent M16 (insulinase) family peptidase